MAKPLIIIYPKLKAEMAYHGHRAEDLGKVLGLKAEAVRKRLRGEVNFTLPEIDKICKFYGKTFEALFIDDRAADASGAAAAGEYADNPTMPQSNARTVGNLMAAAI